MKKYKFICVLASLLATTVICSASSDEEVVHSASAASSVSLKDQGNEEDRQNIPNIITEQKQDEEDEDDYVDFGQEEFIKFLQTDEEQKMWMSREIFFEAMMKKYELMNHALNNPFMIDAYKRMQKREAQFEELNRKLFVEQQRIAEEQKKKAEEQKRIDEQKRDIESRKADKQKRREENTRKWKLEQEQLSRAHMSQLSHLRVGFDPQFSRI